MNDVKEKIAEYKEEIDDLNKSIKEKLEYESLVGFDIDIAKAIMDARKRIADIHEWIDYLRRYEEK
jgi:uncharacterized protein (UPF0335 family)